MADEERRSHEPGFVGEYGLDDGEFDLWLALDCLDRGEMLGDGEIERARAELERRRAGPPLLEAIDVVERVAREAYERAEAEFVSMLAGGFSERVIIASIEAADSPRWMYSAYYNARERDRFEGSAAPRGASAPSAAATVARPQRARASRSRRSGPGGGSSRRSAGRPDDDEPPGLARRRGPGAVPALRLTVPLEGRVVAQLLAGSCEDQWALLNHLRRRDLAFELQIAVDELLAWLADADVDGDAA